MTLLLPLSPAVLLLFLMPHLLLLLLILPQELLRCWKLRSEGESPKGSQQHVLLLLQQSR